MTDLRTAAQQALEALEGGGDSWRLIGPAIDVLHAALEQPEQEPVAWLWEHQLEDLKHYRYRPDMRAWTTEGRIGSFEGLVPVFTHPPRREWRGLTEDEINCVVPYCHNEFDLTEFKDFARAIEAALRSTNHE